MKTGTIVLLVILVILIGILIALYFMGRNLQKKQDEQNARLQANKQPVVIMAHHGGRQEAAQAQGVRTPPGSDRLYSVVCEALQGPDR